MSYKNVTLEQLDIILISKFIPDLFEMDQKIKIIHKIPNKHLPNFWKL